MNKISTRNLFYAISFLLSVPSLAHAHIGVGHTAGLANGLGHPLSGLDHILAMVAVGIWALQVGGRAIWAVPSTFVGMMIIGGVLGMSGITVPFVEQGILMSVLVLGVLIAAAIRLPLSMGMAIVGIFAVFHGHAHGTETPYAASGVLYGSGFALATASLHLAGIGLAMLLQRHHRPQLVRFAGFTIITCGIYLCL
jgi:urease accessory protein